MNRHHLFSDQVAEFLAEQNLQLSRSEEGICFSGGVTTNYGVDLTLCILCILQSLVRVIAILPVAAPAAVHNELVRVLNVINRKVSCGAFTLDPASGRVCLESAAMVPEGEHPGEQLQWLMALNDDVMNRHALKVIGVAIGALSAEGALALVAQESVAPELPAEPDPERFRWN